MIMIILLKIIILCDTKYKLILSLLTSIFMSILFLKKAIHLIFKKKIKEEIRILGLKNENKKKHISSLGGFFVLISTLISVVIYSNLKNIYIIILITTTLLLGTLGLYDDFIKIFKNNKNGITVKNKLFFQLVISCVIGFMVLYNEKYCYKNTENFCSYIRYLFTLVIIITSISNGVNISDGIDGLVVNISLYIMIFMLFLSYLSGDLYYSKILQIDYIENIQEISVFISSLIGSLIGFSWYNSYPAQIFMGDTGSLTIGGLIAVVLIILKKKAIIPILCMIFIIETMSVIIQVLYFKYSKWRNGLGTRIFLMAPIHHHFQKLGYHESKISSRLSTIQMLLLIITLLYYLK